VSPGRDTQAGLTLTEIMISLLLVSVAAAFVFSIQMRTSTALRDQQAIAEMQQTLRSATDHIVRDLRGAGYLARRVRVAKAGGSGTCTPDEANLFELEGVSVDNSSSGPDLLRIVYADASAQAAVTGHTAGDTVVDDVSGFAVGDAVLFVSTDANSPTNPTLGTGCVLQITAIDEATKTLSHAPGTGVNLAGNCQCSEVPTGDLTELLVTRVNLRAYRIKPGDVSGVLQMSPTAGIEDDWVDMAVGIVDLQLALRVQLTGDATDEDGDGNAERDWLSGDNMENALDAATAFLLSASVTLVAKTTKEVNGVLLGQSPDVLEPDAGLTSNRVGDRAGTTLPVTDNASMYYGDFVYRSYTSTVDLRNLGVGL
jgi:prepilin-type N-terminal cleavage/methylation domain-containing protein